MKFILKDASIILIKFLYQDSVTFDALPAQERSS